jgi:xanthine dehydrogenase accessory factor
MSHVTQALIGFIEREGLAGRITLAEVRGSAPREPGTSIAMRRDGRFTGTIGGGALEWQALSEMQKLIAADGASRRRTVALGPELGQCCGGRVTLHFEVLRAADLPRLYTEAEADESRANPTPLLLYGAGHVGRALVLALAPHPFAIHWIDPRSDAFPEAMPRNTRIITGGDVLAPARDTSSLHCTLAISHSHALDLAVADVALRNPACAYLGVIGSETKRARFLSQLRLAGHEDAALQRLTCPIGDRRVRSKEPAAIAASVVVELLIEREKLLAHADTSIPHQHLFTPAPSCWNLHD